MKISILIILAISIIKINAIPKCRKELFCMGCYQSYEDECSSCFNWGSGKIQARTMQSYICADILSLSLQVKDCKYYSGGLSTGATQTADNCQVCNKTWLNWTVHGATAACSNNPVATKCLEIKNCSQNVCYKNADNSYFAGCRMCDEGYHGTGTRNMAGAPECIKIVTHEGVTPVACTSYKNCERYMESSTCTSCASCKAGYAVASDKLSCKAYTEDPNCNRLYSTFPNWCEVCWNGYYWDTSVCKLKSLFVLFNIGLSLGVWVFLW